jgi:hypothetical protein
VWSEWNARNVKLIMAQVVIRQRLSEEPGFDPRSDHVVFILDKVTQEQGLLQFFFSGFPVSIIPPLLLTRHHKNNSVLRPSGQSLGTWQQNSSLPTIGEFWREVMFPDLLICCIQSPVNNPNVLS